MAVFDENLETLEDLGRDNLKLIQSKSGFRFGEDTVLLSWFVAENMRLRRSRPIRALELGTNCGAASILLSGRRKDMLIDGVERQKEASEIFRRNITLNHLEDRVRGFQMDLRDLPSDDLPKNTYDTVFMNPPFRKQGRGPMTGNSNQALLESRFAIHGDAVDFMACAYKMLVPSGDMFLVDRAEAFPELISACSKLHLAPKKVTFVHPYQDKEATLILLQAKKDGKMHGAVVTAPLILRNEDRKYTEETKKIYGEV